MSEPWDGIWTADLLRDLCGGVTRAAGAFKARTYHRSRGAFWANGTVTIERKDRVHYRVGGDDFRRIDAVVDRLNAMYAVPLFEDGREWKVRRPDPAELARNCPDCKGTGKAECGYCDGDGLCECHCGHEHECHECDGVGHVECEACGKAVPHAG